MPAGSAASAGEDMSIEQEESQRPIAEEQGEGSSRRRGNSGKRKQKSGNEDESIGYLRDIASYVSSRSEKTQRSLESDDMFDSCIDILKEMDVLPEDKVTIAHYFETHPRMLRMFYKGDLADRWAIVNDALKNDRA